jgi:hypothetical protein
MHSLSVSLNQPQYLLTAFQSTENMLNGSPFLWAVYESFDTPVCRDYKHQDFLGPFDLSVNIIQVVCTSNITSVYLCLSRNKLTQNVATILYAACLQSLC